MGLRDISSGELQEIIGGQSQSIATLDVGVGGSSDGLRRVLIPIEHTSPVVQFPVIDGEAIPGGRR
jgi:hypothetical protein